MYSSALSETTFSIIWGTLTLESDNNQGRFFKIKPQSVATSYFLLYCIMLPSTSPCPCHLSQPFARFCRDVIEQRTASWHSGLFSSLVWGCLRNKEFLSYPVIDSWGWEELFLPLSAEGLLSFSRWCPGALCTMGFCPSPLFLCSRSRECPPQTALLLMSGSCFAGTQAKTSTTSEPTASFSHEIYGRDNEEDNSCPCWRCKLKKIGGGTTISI